MDKITIQRNMIKAVEKVKQTNPMAGSITNMVTVNFVANAQLAVGGSAAMVYLPDEAEFLAQAGGASYINVGTLLPIYEQTLPSAFKALYGLEKPWVLDPVAIGIGRMRTSLLQQCKAYKPSIIRGNASEIIALASLWELTENKGKSTVRGVDATDTVLAAKDAAVSLANWTGGAVAVSGETDLVTDGAHIVSSYGGSHFMQKITGAGCSLGGVMAVYATATSAFIAALTGTAIYNMAGKKAAEIAKGPGSFEQIFLDQLYQAKAEEIAHHAFDIREV